MESRFSWFCQGPMKDKYVKGAIIETQHPTPRQWKILEVINEHDHQLDKEDVDNEEGIFSHITTRLHCCRLDVPGTRVDIRVYLQVPWTNTEFESPRVRAHQAAEFDLPEFRAYRVMNSDPDVSRFTPRLLGYEIAKQRNEGDVPEKEIGDEDAWSEDMLQIPFWKLKRPLRDDIRTQFKDTYIKLRGLGMYPAVSNSDSLVFDRANEHLYWVGFYDT
ncbi:hypothetical protein N7493_011896 [Penicillium malachiteum]|uniref:Uncharacterized protein n=1 Tax=Penicillium malachiteum TaxID=1324776 RepID=A0AAD6MQI5_9EURO|nr:hypothetical protein N7493_011896 [Penicillium malachiteum]